MPTRPNRPSAALILLVAVAGTAQADIVDMHFTGVGRGQNVLIRAGDRSINTYAGQLFHSVTSADDAWTPGLGAMPFFCTDVYQPVAGSTTPFTLTGLTGVPDSHPMSPTTAAAVESLFASANQAQFGADAPNDLAAAFQLALWEVVSDYDDSAGRSSLDLDGGWFRASGRSNSVLSDAVRSHIDTLFDAVQSHDTFSGQVFAMRSPVAQDQLFAVAGKPPNIPAPAAFATLGLGLCLGIGRRRR